MTCKKTGINLYYIWEHNFLKDKKQVFKILIDLLNEKFNFSNPKRVVELVKLSTREYLIEKVEY